MLHFGSFPLRGDDFFHVACIGLSGFPCQPADLNLLNVHLKCVFFQIIKYGQSL